MVNWGSPQGPILSLTSTFLWQSKSASSASFRAYKIFAARLSQGLGIFTIVKIFEKFKYAHFYSFTLLVYYTTYGTNLIENDNPYPEASKINQHAQYIQYSFFFFLMDFFSILIVRFYPPLLPTFPPLFLRPGCTRKKNERTNPSSHFVHSQIAAFRHQRPCLYMLELSADKSPFYNSKKGKQKGRRSP